jgi:NAD(P)-dependent dehydrogenase (short-subunit alcohol dehydrogenase family)
VQREIAAATGREPRALVCDLASRAAIDRAAGELLGWGIPLHLLVHNAGLVRRDREETVDGVERTVAVNYLAVFQLTLRLLERVRRSAPSRIVIVSSDAHRMASPELEDLESRSGYWVMGSYAKSKLALLYFVRSLSARLAGSGVTVNACDPGPIASGIADDNPGLLAAVASVLVHRLFPSPEKAARTALHLCASPEVEGLTGTYWRFMALKASRLAPDPDAVAERLWRWSVEKTGVLDT